MTEGLQERVEAVRSRIAAACGRAGRDSQSVSLVAVSKGVGPEDIRAASDCGLAVFGESRIQEAAVKIPLCPGGLEWHLVGHLQRNKVGPAVGLFGLIHSVDSERLLQAINDACGESGRVMPVFLEVNVSAESGKFGMPPQELAGVVERSTSLMNVEIRGLMTMPPFRPDPEDARPFFRRLRELRDEARAATGFDLPDLSMGMSGDLEVAIEEGATRVRIGTAVFGERRQKAWRPEEVTSDE